MNEMWASEVERKLRAISDRLGSLNQNALRLEGQLNFGLPTTTPPDGSDVEEVHWIRLTEKAVIAGVNTYAWRRQVYVMTGGGMSWVDSGEFGTIAENPAIGLNNEDRPTNDGKRYPAKFNPDTVQWIFFLTLSVYGSSYDGNFVGSCKIRLVSLVHFPLVGGASTWTPDAGETGLRFPQVNSPGSCPSAMVANSATFADPLTSWIPLSVTSDNLSFVRWNAGGGPAGVSASVQLSKSDWSITGSVAFGEPSSLTTNSSLFAVNWNLQDPQIERMNAGTSGFAVLDRATTDENQFLLTTITNRPVAIGYLFDTLVEFNDTFFPTCSWGGTNPVLQVCWGDGCNAIVDPEPLPITVKSGTEASPVVVRRAMSLLSNSIGPSRMTTTATVQYGTTDPNPFVSLIQAGTTVSAYKITLSPVQNDPVTAQTTATAYAYSESGSLIAGSTASSSAQAKTIPRALPASNTSVAFGSLNAVALSVLNPISVTSSVSTVCNAKMPSQPSPVPSPNTASSFAAATTVRTPSALTNQVAVATLSGAFSVSTPDPGETMSATTTTLSVVAIRTPQAPVTESNPRITVTTSCTATVDEIGITPKP